MFLLSTIDLIYGEKSENLFVAIPHFFRCNRVHIQPAGFFSTEQQNKQVTDIKKGGCMADFSSTIYTLANSLIGQLFVLIYGWHTSKVDIVIYIKKNTKM